MSIPNFDVVVVGGGCAGMTAALGLARAGFSVAVVEAADYPGAENWSGCVYFCENLAHPDILGPEGVEGLAWERRLVERGFFATDGQGILGMTYRDPAAFRHCYTVLRPIFDHHIAQIAVQQGVVLFNATTAESLIREGTKVIGVATNRGAVYADLVFLAEGDASHLVTREGYERFADQRETPKFLQGIKQVIDLPAGAIEDIFGVGPDEGVAYEMLVRNGSLRGKPLKMNMGGFVYTNRQSLSVGLVLPADHLREHFDGDPNLLIEWFEQLPALQAWLKLGQRGVFGAKLIRGGGAKDIPRLVDDGLAIGGAASAIGVDFPYPNFTGPATYMGWLLARAVQRIRSEGGTFTQEQLNRHYLEPLSRSHYWQDVEFLRRWPGYVKKTTVFFDRQIDVALGTAYIWTRPQTWVLTRWFNWLRLAWRTAGPSHWHELRTDWNHLSRALRLDDVVGRPGGWRLLLDGTVNAFRDFFGSARPHLTAAGAIKLHYAVASGAEPSDPPPRLAQRWFGRFGPVLAAAAQRVYANNTEPLAQKLASSVRLLVRQINILDLVGASLLALGSVVAGAVLAGLARIWGKLRKRPAQLEISNLSNRYLRKVRQVTDLTSITAQAGPNWEARLGQLAYDTVKESHIHVLWPQALPKKDQVAAQGLWHVCPAHVYEARQSAQGQLQIVVNFENCIKCETCWRTSDLVDWGRDGKHRFIYPVHSPAVHRLLKASLGAVPAAPPQLRSLDWWENRLRELTSEARGKPGQNDARLLPEVPELVELIDKLDHKLDDFVIALAEEPRTIDRARAGYLEMLARYAQQLAVQFADQVQASTLGVVPRFAPAYRPLSELTAALVKRAEERARRTWDRHYQWAAADGRQLQQHHLVGLRRALHLLGGTGAPSGNGARLPSVAQATHPGANRWLQAEHAAAAVAGQRADWTARLDALFPSQAWRELDRGVPLTPEQDALLRDLLAQVPGIDSNHLPATLHPPVRKLLLAELGRRDPSLAYRAAAHLWARDLARLAGASSPHLQRAQQHWTAGDEWACFASVNATRNARAGWDGTTWLVPAGSARRLLLLLGDQLALVPLDSPQPSAGLCIEPLATLGLRGAGLVRLRLDHFQMPEAHVPVDRARVLRAWKILSAADLTSIAVGMAGLLCERALAHATSRVQFPGLFHDEESRDPIGKFGAVKKMIAEMGAQRLLLETLDHVVSPVDFSSSSAERAGLVKVLTAEALGSAPGSLTYNAGQVFGGTGFSEDDLFAKFYRDASAWRFLGARNVEILRKHGEDLLHNWRSDGHKLASFAHEAELFDQLAQRKALQAELDEIRVLRSQLRELVNELLTVGGASLSLSPAPGRPTAEEPRVTFTSAAVAEMSEALARQDAHLLASKALLLRLHARLESGLPSETDLALVRVWLARVLASLDAFESGLKLQAVLANPVDDGPIVDPSAGPPVTIYKDYLASPVVYDSGAFLEKPIDLLPPRFVPDMIETDPALVQCNRHFQELLTGWFGPLRDGLVFERSIERAHRPAAADLDFCRDHGFFRMPIPRDLGGEARSKVDYYLLTTNCQRLADVAISLTIQVNSSLGTTPVLLARSKDLPRADKDLAKFATAAAPQQDCTDRLTRLLKLMELGRAPEIELAYRDLNNRLEELIQGSAAVRALLHRFLEAWQPAGRAGRGFDLPGMRRLLEQAVSHWRAGCAQADAYRQEMPRRLEASDLFLRWVAAGQIAAFALTEPSAGSDTARVATRAVLQSVPVEREVDGVLRFVPFGGKEPRYLLDARRLVFPSAEASDRTTVRYRWAEGQEPAPIRFDAYDYETDDPHRLRSYQHGSRTVHFTDIAQLRERDGRLWYDYWELTGAKMWITNGRMCGILCLYAKTEEGITGFIVDRHAEGLVVGKDEDKLGQCGSPTNELALQAVRVPRENVIGIEGRGQVNALETLNVGRAGLAMSAMAQMSGLIEKSRSFAQATYGNIPDWVAWRLQRMEAERFTSEAIAHEVIGRFEHPQTKSVRLESAIAKALVSESLHRVIEWAEDIHGSAGQTQEHLVEKRKRDARVLNIYEGTNEIQRFFILKDLAASPNATVRDTRKTQHTSRETLELETLRLDVRQRVAAALEVFGQELWQNPNLQANCFLLAEAVAWLKAGESTLARLAWQERVAGGKESGVRGQESGAAPRRAFLQCQAEVRGRLRQFDDELAHLRRGFYAEEIRAASLLFEQAGQALLQPPGRNRISRPLAVLVVLEPVASQGPTLHVEDGKLAEPFWTLSPGDRAALETALRLRDEASTGVRLHVVALGQRTLAGVLREVLALGVDRASLLVPETDVDTTTAALAIAAQVRAAGPFDLVLGGAGSAGQAEGLLAQLATEALGLAHAGTSEHLAVQCTDGAADALLTTQQQQRVRALPLGVAITPGLPLRDYTIAGYLQGLARTVEVERWPRRLVGRPVTLLPGSQARETASTTVAGPLRPAGAAVQLLEVLGLHGGPAIPLAPFTGELEDVTHPEVLAGTAVALLAAEADGRLQTSAATVLQAVTLLAEQQRVRAAVLILVNRDEASQRRAVAGVRAQFRGPIVLLSADRPLDGAEVRQRWFHDALQAANLQARVVVGEAWTETALASLALAPVAAAKKPEALPETTLALRLRRLALDRDGFVGEIARAQGKLLARQRLTLHAGATGWLTLTPDAEVIDERPTGMRATAGSEPGGHVKRWQPHLERFFGRADIQRLLEEVQAELGVTKLTDAEFIIDVGFGVGNRDGYEAVIDPLEQALRQLGVHGLMIGGSRKVTEELHLLPADRQIGQSGVPVNPQVLLAIGVSGAPQHLNYIGPRATILAFNRDPEAPIVTLNRRQARPRVFPVLGDLFETVPALIAALRQIPAQPTPLAEEKSAPSA